MTTGGGSFEGRAYVFASAPALVVGATIMRECGVSSALWGQNIVAWVLGTLVCLCVKPSKRGGPTALVMPASSIALVALALTFLDPGVDGVHRWIAIGPMRIHTAAVMLPLLLVALSEMVRSRGFWLACMLAASVTFGLLLQPDAAQATAFAGAAGLLLIKRATSSPARVAAMALSVIAALSWFRDDPVAPVPYVEGIVALAQHLGTWWSAATCLSLILLTAPFALLARATAGVSLVLGAYVALTILTSFVGNFPVPVVGYGISPILGYLLGMGALLHTPRRIGRSV